MQKGFLLLADGTVMKGNIYGEAKNSVGEVVFQTSMTGYQETLSDPAYAGQIVVMTYPLIGNCGINSEDNASDTVALKGMVVRELADYPSNFRCEGSLEQFLTDHHIIAIDGIDTRALTRILRDKGTMNGAIIVGEPEEQNIQELLSQIKQYVIQQPVMEVSGKEIAVYACDPALYRVAVYDFGLTTNVLHSLMNRKCEVTVYPADTSAETILKDAPDGIMVANGPGNPKDCAAIIENIKALMQKKVPMFGIGLGHQLMALAMGGDTMKLKYGHRGSNQPVQDLAQGKTYNTIQNHGYAVVADSIAPETGKVSHININDNTVEGICYNGGAFSVQFHPEASAGAMDTGYLFDQFIALMADNKERR